MEEIVKKVLTGERAAFGVKNTKFINCTFADGESPLKQSSDIDIEECLFKWKYPVWYSKNVNVQGSTLFETARAGIWYTDNINIKDSIIEAPKTFRRSKNITLENVDMPNASETLWSCDGVNMNKVTAKGDYFAMNAKNINADDLRLVGNYSFDGVKNAVIRNSKLLSKDAFWNSENITVYDSFISGEYFGWNAKNLTLINCTIESLQGFCYIENLVLKNCKLLNTTLAFEYCSVQAQINGGVDSVLNPSSGKITADYIGELIIEKDKVDPRKTVIICNDSKSESEKLVQFRNGNG